MKIATFEALTAYVRSIAAKTGQDVYAVVDGLGLAATATAAARAGCTEDEVREFMGLIRKWREGASP